jgi:hypothetical protein
MAQLVEDQIHAEALDKLHDVVGLAVVLADAEDRDDVGVVQLGRGLGLALEPPLLPCVAEPMVG